MPVNNTVSIRKGSSTDWFNANPILASGELGYDITNKILKIGDGTTNWNSLANHNHSASNISDFNSSVSGLLPVTNITGGSNITVSQSGTIYTVAVTGSLGLTTEEVDDRVAALLIAGSGINLSYNDSGNALTISSSGLISNPTNNRILTSRDSTTINIDAESNLVFTGSNLGVNTSSPSGALHVVGSGLIASVTGTIPNSLLHVYSATSGDNIFNVEGTNGSLFSITDNLSGTLMSVNNSAGLPVFEVFSDDSIIGGRYNQNDFIISSSGNIGIGTSSPSSKLNVVGSVGVSGVLTATSGNFTNSLTINSVDVSTSGHTHIASNITDFNSAVSGLLSKSIAFFTPADNQPPVTNYAILDTRNSILVLNFDANTQWSAVFCGVIPQNASLTNGLTVRIWWMGQTATSGNVRWGVSFEKTGTDNDADSFDTVTQATGAANGTSGIETVTSITATTIDSIAAGDRYRLKVTRIADDATNDTMTGNAQLVAVEVQVA